MSTVAVARKDFQDAVRSRSLWALSAVFLLFGLATTYVYLAAPELLMLPGEQTTVGMIVFLAGTVALFISLTTIVVAYKAIAGEREIGSIKLLLALPHTRRDVLAGKVLGRTGVLALPVVLALVAAGVMGLAMLETFDVVAYLAFVAVTAAFVLAYVSIVVGISASTASTGRASALAVGFFLVFELLWDGISMAVVWVANGFALPATMPDWLFVVNQIPPSSAFTTAMLALVPGASEDAAAMTAGYDAFYATSWLGVAMLVVWIVVPLAVGYWRFEHDDL